ncbi:unnamed protein product [Lymnaea stagnalis]|uniref:FAM194 C-terminal domain-containing protein n=1 Tax=Lymnaea stagnalis TaxID=6523 RepID=A0AAV2HHM7_LYMST
MESSESDDSTDANHDEDNLNTEVPLTDFMNNDKLSVLNPRGIQEKESAQKETKELNSTDDDNRGKSKSIKKRHKKLKKLKESRTTFDGRKVTFVTYFTQTDWKWKDNVETTGRGRILSPSQELRSSSSCNISGHRSQLAKPDSRQTSGKTRTEDGSVVDDRTVTDLSPFSLQPNDEFGLPIEELSSDSDTTDGESPKKIKTRKHNFPIVGPPLILKYIPESDLPVQRETTKETEAQLVNPSDYVLDEYGNAVGMFSGKCEFCGNEIKPFPTLDQQLSEPPETLYCCEDYRDFVEFAMTTANRLEEDVTKKSEMISVKVHGHHGSKQARKMAKEQAVQRMHERELQRRQQEASGMQSSIYQHSRMLQNDDSDTGADTVDNLQPKKSKKKDGETSATKGEVGKGEKGGVLGGEKTARGGGVDGSSRTSHHHPSGMHPGAAAASFSSYGGVNIEVARQMKTINYQLSSQRCLEEGWTLRPPTPLDQDDADNEIFMPEPLHPAMIATGKLQGRQLVQKFYPNGSKFLTIFPDGSGNVFYPSGRLAIMIICVSLGQNMYVVLDDDPDAHILATFEPSGLGCCNFANGKIRVNYDQLGGVELDPIGSRKKLWRWQDQDIHVHAPPFQPITFGMNRYIAIRFMAQESIALTLTGRNRSCRFNVGAKLKMIYSEGIQPKHINEYELFAEEHKVKVVGILDKIGNLLKFPKSPKVDSILPPISVSSQQQKVDKKRQQFMSSLTKHKKPGKQTRLPPMDHPSVSVTVN